MPHIIVEYSENVLEQVDFKDFFKRLHTLLIENGPFKLQDIKSRAISHPFFYVADGKGSNGFVHLTLSILKGRDLSLRQALAEKILLLLEQEYARSYGELNCSISVEIKELDGDTYRKISSNALNAS